jgi:hypothetical protein
MYLAIDICRDFAKFPEEKLIPVMEKIVKEANWWDLTDSISPIIGKLILAERHATKYHQKLKDWANGKYYLFSILKS